MGIHYRALKGGGFMFMGGRYLGSLRGRAVLRLLLGPVATAP